MPLSPLSKMPLLLASRQTRSPIDMRRQVGEVGGQHRRSDHSQVVDLPVDGGDAFDFQLDRAHVGEVGTAAGDRHKVLKPDVDLARPRHR